MSEQQYPDKFSDVEIVFTDGTIETYRISAGAGIGRYLVESAGRDRVLSLSDRTRGVSWAFPLANVRSWKLTEIEDAPAEEAK